MKVYPGDIDGVVERFTATLDVCSFAYADPLLGEEVGVAVALKQNDDATLRRAARWASEHLAAHQLPQRWYVLEKFRAKRAARSIESPSPRPARVSNRSTSAGFSGVSARRPTSDPARTTCATDPGLESGDRRTPARRHSPDHVGSIRLAGSLQSHALDRGTDRAPHRSGVIGLGRRVEHHRRCRRVHRTNAPVVTAPGVPPPQLAAGRGKRDKLPAFQTRGIGGSTPKSISIVV